MTSGGRRRKQRARRAREAGERFRTELAGAKEFMQSPSTDLFERVTTADIFLRHCLEDNVSYAELLFFLETADEAAFMAARALNIKSGRRDESEIQLSDLIIDREFWRDYLAANGKTPNQSVERTAEDGGRSP